MTNEISEKAKIDFKKYQTPELVSQIVELISIPKAVFKIGLFAAITGFALPAFYVLVFLFSNLPIWGWLMVVLYGAIAGIILGAGLGILFLIRKALANIESILSMILNIANRMADDYGQLACGEAELPSGHELVEQAYDEIVLPSMEQAAKKAFGFLATPIIWVYRRTIGSAVRYVVKRVAKSQVGKLENSKTANAVRETTCKSLAATTTYTDRIGEYTKRAMEMVAGIGRKIRFVAMFPLFVLWITAFLASTTVIIVVRIVIAFH